MGGEEPQQGPRTTNLWGVSGEARVLMGPNRHCTIKNIIPPSERPWVRLGHVVRSMHVRLHPNTVSAVLNKQVTFLRARMAACIAPLGVGLCTFFLQSRLPVPFRGAGRITHPSSFSRGQSCKDQGHSDGGQCNLHCFVQPWLVHQQPIYSKHGASVMQA